MGRKGPEQKGAGASVFVKPKTLGALKRPERPGEINFGHRTPLFVPPPTRVRAVQQREDSTGGAAAAGRGAPGTGSRPTAPRATPRPVGRDGAAERQGRRPQTGGMVVTEDLVHPPERRPRVAQDLTTAAPGSLLTSFVQRPLLVYSPGSYRVDFRAKMFVSEFGLPTGTDLYGG